MFAGDGGRLCYMGNLYSHYLMFLCGEATFMTIATAMTVKMTRRTTTMRIIDDGNDGNDVSDRMLMLS